MENPFYRRLGSGEYKGIPGFAKKMVRWQLLTMVISEEELSSYLRVASATGFKVTKIADQGQKFPSRCGGVMGDDPISVDYFKLTTKGGIAVSIERPENSRDHAPFWEKLASIQQWKV